MKKLVLTMASLVMLASMAFAQETPMLPESHGLTDNQPAWGGSQTFSLAQGWNWWSTYINVSGQEGLEALETALGTKATMIKGELGFIMYDNGSWSGLLNSIENERMYAIQMTEATEITMRGSRATADLTPINLSHEGWNWIGYPVAVQLPINDALANYTNATNGEILKTFNEGFAVYENGQWLGTPGMMMNPGNGYKLNYLGTEPTSFVYNTNVTAKGREMVSSSPMATEWQPQTASNPDNMNMIAVVNLDNEELRSDNVEIGVFNGETCRGAVRPIYVESLDQYIVFLTMFGENNEPYSFRMLDESGNVYESNEASVSFKADAVIGKLHSPFNLNFSSKNSSFAGALNLFPNPVNRGEMVNLTLPAEGTVEVINVLGSTMKRVRMAEGSQLAADMAPGIYTIKVTDAEGNVYVDKLVVK